jgi:hypothetical protein
MPDTETVPRRESTWNDCDAHARYIDDKGHETVVVCDSDRHSPPDDTEAEHHDPNLGIVWRYDDDEVRFDD